MTMGDAHSHDLSRQVKIYICVFIGLLVGTLVTVGMYYVHFTSMAVTVSVALFIATVKAFLVAGFFMHLMCAILNLPWRQASNGLNSWFMLNNCSISRIAVHKDEVAIYYLNRIDHLPDHLVTG